MTAARDTVAGEPRDTVEDAAHSVTRFRIGDEEFVVVAAHSEPPPSFPALTPAEAALVAAILAGMSNQRIAAERQTSVRTVNNQMTGLFRKLGVRSRAEVVVRCAAEKERGIP